MRNFCLSLTVVGLLLFSSTAYPANLAQRILSSPMELEGGFISEQLTNGYDDWSSIYINLASKLDRGKTLYASLRETNRFGLKDSEGKLGYYHPLKKNWSVNLEGQSSFTHKVLPRWSLFASLIREFPDGWVFNLGYRKTQYNNSRVNLSVASVEKYVGNYHATYSFYLSNLEGNGSAQANSVRLSYYYTDTNRVGAAFSSGQELEYLGPTLGVLKSDVKAFSVFGRHSISQELAVSYSVGYHEQGKSYIKRGLQVGIRHTF